MAKEEDDVLQANAGAPAANIPDLKKKEKERKKAGAAWSGARGASEFSGATGGNVARAAASAAEAAEGAAGALGEGAAGLAEGAAGLAEGAAGAESGGFFGAISRFFSVIDGYIAGLAESLGMGEAWATVSEFIAEAWAGLTATALGRMAVAAAMFLMVAAAGLLGYAMLKGGGSASLGSPDLGGITDSMHVRSGGDDRLGVASNGELRFDPQVAAKPAAAPPPADATKAADKAAPPPAAGDQADSGGLPMASGQLAHNLSGAQLSSSLGGEFGSKNIFTGNSSAPKFGGGAGLPKFQAAKGKLAAMRPSSARASASKEAIGKATSSRAIGQLKYANGSSIGAETAGTNEVAAQGAQGAFDQQPMTGGNLTTPTPGPGDGGGGGGGVTGGGGGGTGGGGGGGGAGSVGGGGTPGELITTPGTTGVDPALASMLAQISALADQAMNDMATGTEELIAGIAMCALAYTLWAGFVWVGAACLAAGLALIAMGYMNIQKAKQEAAQAKQMGTQLAGSLGNTPASNAVTYCTNQALGGTPMNDCNPPDSVTGANTPEADGSLAADQAKVAAEANSAPSVSQGSISQ
jgi:hypothetical protein